MSNFLPPEAHAVIRREYRVRVASVWALLLAAVVAVATVLLIPTYTLLVAQMNALALEVMHTEDTTETTMVAYEAAQATLRKAHVLARQLSFHSTGTTASEILGEIQKSQTRAISITAFTYDHTDTEVNEVHIDGVAQTREALVAFAGTLERNPLFARAEVPVSDLAEGSDAVFGLTLVLADGATVSP